MVKACLDWPTCIIPRDKATDLVFEKKYVFNAKRPSAICKRNTSLGNNLVYNGMQFYYSQLKSTYPIMHRLVLSKL